MYFFFSHLRAKRKSFWFINSLFQDYPNIKDAFYINKICINLFVCNLPHKGIGFLLVSYLIYREFLNMAIKLDQGPKLGNAPPPEIIFRGPLKMFSWMVMQKSEPRRGDAKLGGYGNMPTQKILRNLTLFWRLFVRFEPLKFLSFNKV